MLLKALSRSSGVTATSAGNGAGSTSLDGSDTSQSLGATSMGSLNGPSDDSVGVMSDQTVHRRPLGCCSSAVMLSFPSTAMERRFFLEHLHSDAHYNVAKYAFYMLVIIYVALISVTLAVRGDYSETQKIFTDVLRTIIAPVLNLLVWGTVRVYSSTPAAVAWQSDLVKPQSRFFAVHVQGVVLTHVPKLRRFANLQLIVVVPLGACCLISLTSHAARSRHNLT